MKTLSVKQVADVLGVTSRAVLKRLSNGQLKGTRRTNKYGVEEWWVYPNKEIRSTLEASGRIDILGGNEALSDAVVVDIDTQNFAPDDDLSNEEEEEVSSTQVNAGAWADNARVGTSGVAEELWNNIISRFLGELKERDQLIGEMRSELADKDRQLKLLPDLEKQAEEERKAAEIRALEVEALNKQIAAMAEERQQLEAKANEASVLAADLQSLKTKVEELQKPWWKKWLSAPQSSEPQLHK